MNHDEAFELIAPMALDALETDVSLKVDEHVEGCSRCRVELDAMRNVASAMGNTHEPLPEGLWGKIAARLYEGDGPEEVPALALGRLPTPDERERQSLGATRRVRAWAVTISLAAAAAMIALGLSLAGANGQVSRLQTALNANGGSAVLAALAAPGHKVVTMKDAQNQSLAKFVVLPDGQGYLISSSLPTLASTSTYQLWGFVDGAPVSVGVIGSSPRQVAFTLASSPGPTSLALTVEPSSGSLRPSTSLVATGTV